MVDIKWGKLQIIYTKHNQLKKRLWGFLFWVIYLENILFTTQLKRLNWILFHCILHMVVHLYIHYESFCTVQQTSRICNGAYCFKFTLCFRVFIHSNLTTMLILNNTCFLKLFDVPCNNPTLNSIFQLLMDIIILCI